MRLLPAIRGMRVLRSVARVVLLASFVAFVRSAGAACVGDCSGDGEVTIDEILLGVNIALDNKPVSSCSSFDANGDGEVSIDEIILAVNAALFGCPAEATATATASASPTPPASSSPTATTTPTAATPSATATGPTPTATGTPGDFARAFAGEAAIVGNGLGAFAPLVTGIITGLRS
ncbi:MAG TPA: hypothetical protein VMT89_16385, partial [Candidatus Acidoferrales bacterium]|nr:hypothetical protein [Candidatus Acidoferrales bacterium]